MKFILMVSTCMITLLSASTVSAFYFGLCSEPSEPSCLMFNTGFEDEWAFNNCKSEVESYISNVEMYRSCLDDEANEKISEIQRLKGEINDVREEQSSAVAKANTVIERFNCYARGESYCP